MWPSFLLPAAAVLYPPPASAFVTAMSVVSFASMASAGLSELRGEHMAYSKFWHVVSGQEQQKRGAGAGGALLSSREGMLVAYAPALVAAAVSFAVPGAVKGLRAQILAAALAVHFLKRVLEVMSFFRIQYDLHCFYIPHRPFDRYVLLVYCKLATKDGPVHEPEFSFSMKKFSPENLGISVVSVVTDVVPVFMSEYLYATHGFEPYLNQNQTYLVKLRLYLNPTFPTAVLSMN
jgi:hypothetical protein